MTEAKIDRRNILAVLGIGGALGVSTEAIGEAMPIGKGSVSFAKRSIETQLKIADALEKLAYEIRSEQVEAYSLDVKSAFNHDDWLQHTVSVTVEIRA